MHRRRELGDAVKRLRAFLDVPEPSPEDIECPYPGMAPFRREDARRFFGREDEIRELRQRLDEQSLILLMGPSGSGKSSLLSAGLIPALPTELDFLSRCGQGPNRSTPCGQPSPRSPAPTSTSPAGSTPPTLTGKHLLLIVDQLEELFVQTAKKDQAAFIDAISRLHRCPGWTVILALRADFYPDLMTSQSVAAEARTEAGGCPSAR